MSEQRQGGLGVQDGQREKHDEPPMYRVILHNDDYTPQDFVVALLVNVFRHDETTAERIMMRVHSKGVGTAGEFSFEVAEMKVVTSIDLARKYDYPLEVSLEPTS